MEKVVTLLQFLNLDGSGPHQTKTAPFSRPHAVRNSDTICKPLDELIH